MVAAARGEREARDTAINLRAPKSWRDLVDRAATATGKSRTDFILESARTNAINVLLDQSLFALAPDRHKAFMAALDAPPAPNEQLRKLLKRKAPWER